MAKSDSDFPSWTLTDSEYKAARGDPLPTEEFKRLVQIRNEYKAAGSLDAWRDMDNPLAQSDRRIWEAKQRKRELYDRAERNQQRGRASTKAFLVIVLPLIAFGVSFVLAQPIAMAGVVFVTILLWATPISHRVFDRELPGWVLLFAIVAGIVTYFWTKGMTG